jgi:hypothetical protein
MWERDIPIERRFGHTRCVSARVFNRDPMAVLAMFGLKALPDELAEVPAEKAEDILEAILWKDLAYCSEGMPLSKARELAHDFVKENALRGSKFFVNADWSKYIRDATGCSWTRLTSATFDGGVVAIGGGFASCVWVEDED